MDAMNLVVLMCAVLAALALGVLLAYACCQMLFSLLRMHARSLAPVPAPMLAEGQVARAQTAS
jgi:hypothetical protein